MRCIRRGISYEVHTFRSLHYIMQCTAEKGAVERAIMIRPEKALKRRLCKGRIKGKREE